MGTSSEIMAIHGCILISSPSLQPFAYVLPRNKSAVRKSGFTQDSIAGKYWDLFYNPQKQVSAFIKVL
jgi:hypothetical protein